MTILVTIFVLTTILAMISLVISVNEYNEEGTISITIIGIILIVLFMTEVTGKLELLKENKLYKKVLYENNLAIFDKTGEIILKDGEK